jgi:hypothetical protein
MLDRYEAKNGWLKQLTASHEPPVNGDYLFFLLSGACVRADPATLFCAFVDFGSRRIFAACEATFLEVLSFLAISYHSIFICCQRVKTQRSLPHSSKLT